MYPADREPKLPPNAESRRTGSYDSSGVFSLKYVGGDEVEQRGAVAESGSEEKGRRPSGGFAYGGADSSQDGDDDEKEEGAGLVGDLSPDAAGEPSSQEESGGHPHAHDAEGDDEMPGLVDENAEREPGGDKHGSKGKNHPGAPAVQDRPGQGESGGKYQKIDGVGEGARSPAPPELLDLGQIEHPIEAARSRGEKMKRVPSARMIQP